METGRPEKRNPIVILVVGLGLLASCTTGQTTVPPISQTPESTTTSTTVVETAPPTPPATTAPEPSGSPVAALPMSADAVVTRSGVPVAVVEQLARGFLVTTPCGNIRAISSGTALGPIDIVIDPGHGGEPDPGAVGGNGLTESEINLRVAQEMASSLRGRGFSVALTRTADYTSPLGVRAAFADHVGAELMISIHHNAPTANLTSIPGTEVFIQHDDADSRRLGELVYGFVVDALSEFDDMTWSSAPDAGAIEVLNTRGTDAYGMLRTPSTVTVLVELAYISHRPEAELMLSPRYVAMTAEALADAAVAYLETEETGRGYVATPRVFNPQRGVSGSVCEDPPLD